MMDQQIKAAKKIKAMRNKDKPIPIEKTFVTRYNGKPSITEKLSWWKYGSKWHIGVLYHDESDCMLHGSMGAILHMIILLI